MKGLINNSIGVVVLVMVAVFVVYQWGIAS